MAELSAADRKSILGADYREAEVTEASLAAGKAAKWVSARNTVIGLVLAALLVAVLVFFRS
jgi:hypothetical protein